MDENIWIIELESALLENDCGQTDILNICKGREIPEQIRPEVWLACLNVRNKEDSMKSFDEVFDLPYQSRLRTDIQASVEKLGNDDDWELMAVMSDLESICTFYCKRKGVEYDSSWIDLLLPLLSLKVTRAETYNLFEGIRDSYIPKNAKEAFPLLRLLLQYHDPELLSFLDSKRITPELYASHWFNTLFGATCTLPVVLSLWDVYFQHNDPFLIFFMSLIMLINGRDTIMAMKSEDKTIIVDYLKNMASALEQEDVQDFMQLAQYYSLKTPSTFKTETFQTFFGLASKTSQATGQKIGISDALCLPVSVNELVEVSSIERTHPDACKFFLVDCRSAEEYNNGHLSNAFHLDYNLMLSDPAAFQTAVNGLLRSQKQAIELHASGEHLCFVSDNDAYVFMVISSFLQKNTKYISVLSGGFQAIHDYFGDHMLDCLEEHNMAKCSICVKKRENGTNSDKETSVTSESSAKLTKSTSHDLFGKISSVMKSKSAEVKGKIIEYIVNPVQTPSTPLTDRHVYPNERNGKRYRNVPPVFSIDDTDDGEMSSPVFQEEDESHETLNLPNFLKDSSIVRSFTCQEVHMNGFMYDTVLAFTDNHIIILRELGQDNLAKIVAKRSLSSIVKITAKKRHQNLITFKYGVPEGENLIITDMDRFLIPNANEATKAISKLILKQM